MKKIFMTICAAVLLGLSVNAQISEGGKPESFKLLLKSEQAVPIKKMAPVDVEKLLKEDGKNNGKKGKYRFAKRFFVDYSTENSGVWQTQSDGSRLWRLGVQSEGAYSLNVIFSRYNMPEGAKVFLYNEDKDHVLGAFTDLNNKKEGVLAVQPVYGDKIYIELYVPSNVTFEPELVVGQIGHDYKGSFVNPKNKVNLKSQSCNVDINCSEGEAWQAEKRSVCKIIIDGMYLCTGTLLNNTKQDGTPYFLTAHHCVDHDPAGSGPKIVYYFNYENKTCNGGGASQSQSVSGSQLRATTPNLDFALYEMSKVPPAAYKPYYAGWDRSGNNPTEVTGIHHPGGDVKKICGDKDGATTGYAGYDYNTHWHVPSWDYGTTEGGSSGSGLFDQNHRLVGDLTGGDAGCDYNFNDYYTQFHQSWNRYPGSGTSLKSWLDPTNSGVITLDGYDPQNTTVVAVSGVGVSPKNISVAVDGNAKLTATVQPTNATNKNVTWSSSNTSVAKVSSNGVVTGVAEGDAVITVKTKDGGFTATSKVTVDGTVQATCNDGIQNGDEEGVDCGGSCPNTCEPENDCPASHPYFACGRCWESKAQAESGGCRKKAEKQMTEQEFAVYPNPVESMLTIQGISAKTGYKVYNSTGTVVFDGNGNVLDVSEFVSGVFILVTETGKQIRFLKE